jgi:hypothetical protein
MPSCSTRVVTQAEAVMGTVVYVIVVLVTAAVDIEERLMVGMTAVDIEERVMVRMTMVVREETVVVIMTMVVRTA